MKSKKLNFLFFLVHPAKFHFHKVQINQLKEKGHHVDVLIITKDMLEDLVIEEGWEYTNIFPEGRKIKNVPVMIGAFISFFKSIYRLWKYTIGKKYDLYVGDLLSVLSLIRRTHSLHPTDDVFAAVPEDLIFFLTTEHAIAPVVCDLGRFNKYKIGYKGIKALAHLHPNHFKPNKKVLPIELQDGSPYFLIRCTGFMATHDINKSGISDKVLLKLVKLLKPYGKIFITSERILPKELNQYQLTIRKNDITHYMSFANIFISDSTTMSAEAAVLGTPSIEIDEYFYEIEQMIQLEKKYKLIHCYRVNEIDQFFDKINQLLKIKNLENIYHNRKNKMLSEMIDLSEFLVWLFENYPESKNEYFLNPDIQNRFIYSLPIAEKNNEG